MVHRVFRHSPFLMVLSLGFTAVLCTGIPADQAQGEALPIKAGFAEEDITPSIGMEEPGNYYKTFSTKFHDPCKVRVAVFDDGAKRVALIGVDALLMPRDLAVKARAEITKQCGIPGEAILIGASHSHSSGPIGMNQPGEYDFAPEEIQRLAYEESQCADPGYLLKVEKAIVDAVVRADRTKVPARLGFGKGREDSVSFNRRLRMKNGLSHSHPGYGNPDVVDYAGPIDPDVGVIAAWDDHENLLGTIVNFSCHATTGVGGISANWIYHMEQTIQGALHTRAPVVYLQGACGDITQVDNLSPYRLNDEARRVGGRVGAEAVKVIFGMIRTPEVHLDHQQKTWPVKRRIPRPAKVEAARSILKSALDHRTADWLFAKETVVLDALVRERPEVEVEVQVIQVGPVVCISNPAEFFVSEGLRIKQESGFPLPWIVELANGCTGYVPSEEAFGPQGGGYETRLTTYSNLEVTASTQMADAGIELSRRLTPQPLPLPPDLKGPSRPWSFGNVPPELE